ncbi:bifunctional 2-polyprenyl-6-hydroxyphenol methylase/3-demethylubiquinol 3-O-methyltransferase UbiG [Swingsia samuiensis]|uniref:Ubiquinone biosynthesis O-methyltransferase n=1 Tax=Swingsia samuiensis TaxID=1293412 RepID=A0A4Y6UGM4_9PROT|nr:bifunctional 2-polyprenyl-6-hydroxyphenol methylase/3-demethylubiquinol 3-O-methyltransferase UbiG [Swingsia samuiensis]QDH16164.1 bifunctional 2-polyprenyl-6-hydroxyphenol methylase/3-demethylubiquinol 3-O-methyltransferase UbiG [Swingsia samuiensis]
MSLDAISEKKMNRPSVSEAEIAHFSALAKDWWDPHGPMAPLHAMNPLRTEWIYSHTSHLQKKNTATPLSLLDIGCGAGLASEAFAKLGFNTLGIDASYEGIQAAKAHQASFPLPPSSAPLSYRHGSAEDLVAERKEFDIVSALEIIEHVNDPQEFLNMLSSLTRPGGYVAVSTMSRTLRSYAMAKLGAEYLLRMLPIGTHDWKKFINPDELATMARKAGLRVTNVSGMTYIPPKWRISKNTSINYIALFSK